MTSVLHDVGRLEPPTPPEGVVLPVLRDVAWVAAYLGMSAKFVRVHACQFGGIKMGKEWRFPEPGIAAGVEMLRRASEASAVGDPPPASSIGVSAASLRRHARRLHGAPR